MEVDAFLLNLTSDDPAALCRFYREVVCLPLAPEVSTSTFKVSGAYLSIDGHSEVHGPAKEPQRYLINFLVADLAVEQQRLEAQGVSFIRTGGREGHGAVISTFLDPDGNYCQLVQLAAPAG